MTRKPLPLVLALAATLLLAACGVDGEPQAPSQVASQTGVTISGEARFGVTN